MPIRVASVKGDLFHLQGNIRQPLLYGSIALILLILRISPVKTTLIGLRQRLQELNPFKSAESLPPHRKIEEKQA